MQRFILPVARAEKGHLLSPSPNRMPAPTPVRSRPARCQQGDHLVLNGVKRFISGRCSGDMAIVIANTSDDPPRETTAFFVERDRPGFRVEGGYKTMAGQSTPATST